MAQRATKAVPPKPVAPEDDSERRFWDWDVDGNVAAGTFVEAGEGYTKLGTKNPFVVLKIDGVERTVWAHHKALRSKIRERIAEHGPIEPGERVTVTRNPDKTTSADGFEYYGYSVTFPDLPQKDQYDLFGAEKADAQETGGVAGEHALDDIPFMP